MVIPESAQLGTLWVCYRRHGDARGIVSPGCSALLTEVRQEDGTVEYLRAGERIRMDWDSFSQFYARSGSQRAGDQ